MSYLGLKPSTTSFATDTFSGDGASVNYTLTRVPASVNSILVHVDGAKLNPSKYTLSGALLSFLAAPGIGVDNVEVVHLGVRTEATQPADASVGLKQIATEVKNILTRKNKIINGNFDIWQRGSTQTLNGYGSVDRFTSLVSGSTQAVSKQLFTLGQINVPNEPSNYYRNVVASVVGAANYTMLVQRIESVRTLAGKTTTISFWAKADAVKNIALEFVQNFGTGGTPSAEVISIGNTTFNLTTAWKLFTATVTLPTITGKTLGTNDNDYLGINLWFDAGSNFDLRTGALGNQSGTFDIAQMQVEEGSFATDFEQRPIGEEISLCQRYYEKSYDLDVDPGVGVGKGGTFFHTTGAASSYRTKDFKVRKRTDPAINIYSDSDGSGTTIRDYTGISNVPYVIGGFSATVFNISPSTPVLNHIYEFQFTADAEL